MTARAAPEPIDRLLKLPQVKDMTGLGKTMIYSLIRKGEFPTPHKPGGYASRWSESEVRAWVEAARLPKAA